MRDAKQALRRCTLFSSFDDKEIEALHENSRRVTATTAEILFREGEPGDYLFVIVSGSVRIVTRTGPSREQTLALLGPGHSFGEMALLDGESRSAAAAAARPSILIRIDRSDLEAVQRRYPETANKFLADGVRLVSARLRSGNAHFLELARLGIEARAQVEQMRSQILSLVSHELRTPLTIIKNSAQILRGAGQKEERQQLFVEKIERQSERLRLLVDDLIALAMLQAKHGIQQATEFDVIELTEAVVQQLQGAAREKGLRLSMVRRDHTARIGADRTLVERALHHLVANALKFSSPSCEVRVEAEKRGEGVRVSVFDHGPGISPEARERIFQPFSQEQNPLNREIDGLGIGLTLVREVVKAHGGRLLVDSASGGGSRFTMELPGASGCQAAEHAEERSDSNDDSKSQSPRGRRPERYCRHD